MLTGGPDMLTGPASILTSSAVESRMLLHGYFGPKQIGARPLVAGRRADSLDRRCEALGP